ncbi:hypothetical protein EJB05_36778 [Eragrostis curvula]|uniref:DUF6598 domain-containing protein n=1 Tax=Eragrostis curvula TaxID=38414 RepID=A0A5J9UAQ4_9POAL|nr:hypothetical protein EJB05_36778 [Eragrostis curvula]
MALVISGDGDTNPVGRRTASCPTFFEPRRWDPKELTSEQRFQVRDLNELTIEESAMTVFHPHSGSSNRYYLEKDSKVVDVSYSVEDSDGILNVEDDDSSTADDDGVSSAEDYLSTDDDDGGSPTDDSDGGSSTDDDNGGLSVERYDCGSSTEDDDGCLSVEAALARDLAYWEAMEYVPEWSKEQNVVEALHIVRCQEFTEVDPKLGFAVPTRFCQFNIALFDFEKESLAGLGEPLSKLTDSQKTLLDASINIISLVVPESDVGYPISVFGTILARDDVDFKCVYLFRRSRDSPQVITSPNDTLTLTGPSRGLSATDNMFFEINLKIKGDDGDKDFSKGVIEHCGTDSCHTKAFVTRRLTSWMSTVQLVYTYVPRALEATVAIKVLKGLQSFNGVVTAWTSGNKNKIVLHDSKVAGMSTEVGADGSVDLTRCLVVVPMNQALMMAISVQDGDHEAALEFKLTLGHLDGECICKQGSCELQVMVTWTSMLMNRKHEVFEKVGSVILVV